MALVDFEWDLEDVEDVGLCFVAIATDTETGELFRVAIAVTELEDLANRKVEKHEQRQH